MKDDGVFLKKALRWAQQFPVCCCLQSNHYNDPYSAFDGMLAAGVQVQLECHENAFEKLKAFYEVHKTWMFGFLTYDLKNETEALRSDKPDPLSFPLLYFFVPQYLIRIKNNVPEMLLGDAGILQEIDAFADDKAFADGAELTEPTGIPIRQRISRKAYMHTIDKLKAHIRKGDIYEVNFCQEFFAENTVIDPFAVYQQLNTISPVPFSGFFKTGHKFILSASPERFLCKRGNRLFSQPIKGTARRSADPVEDGQIKAALKSSVKEQAENVMIVDLVRNDLTKSAVKGSVRVEELFGVYSFPQVHQLISTVSCTLREDLHPVDSIKNTFPMGSMTGAPKIRAMQLIEQYEQSKRGVYSGAVGYLDPDGDFDFNVVIRSIVYNSEKQYLSFQVGGAITYASNAEQEYEECLLKASAILKVLDTISPYNIS